MPEQLNIRPGFDAAEVRGSISRSDGASRRQQVGVGFAFARPFAGIEMNEAHLETAGALVAATPHVF
jgi:hypothetical protein